MRTFFLSLFIMFSLFTFAISQAKQAAISFTTSVGSYNILSQTVTTKGPLWDVRKPHVKDIILSEAFSPDILGIQECQENAQSADMIQMLQQDYDYHLESTKTSSRLIFWKRNKYDLVEAFMIDLFKDKYPGMYQNQRYTHYVRLREKSTQKEILFYNIHLRAGADLPTHQLRTEEIDSLCNEAAKRSMQLGNLPVIIVGDMNCRPGTVIGGIPSSPNRFFEHGFEDTFRKTNNIIDGDYYTYSSLEAVQACEVKAGSGGSGRIDYIFNYPTDRFEVQEFSIILNFTNKANLQLACPMPSDHHPVKSVLKISYPAPSMTFDSVRIGNQYWMAKNLNTTQFNNGDYIATGFSNAEWIDLLDKETNTGTPAYCKYPNATDEDGLLYNWFAATDPRGVCPEGWRVPSDDDWIVLEQFLGMDSETANSEGWRHTSREAIYLKTNEKDFGLSAGTYGFNALPSGHRDKADGVFKTYDVDAYFWASTTVDPDDPNLKFQGRRRLLRYSRNDINRSGIHKGAGMSIRCIKDQLTNVPTVNGATPTIKQELIFNLTGMPIHNTAQALLPEGIYIKLKNFDDGSMQSKKFIIKH